MLLPILLYVCMCACTCVVLVNIGKCRYRCSGVWKPKLMAGISIHQFIIFEAGSLNQSQRTWIWLISLESFLWGVPCLCLQRFTLQWTEVPTTIYMDSENPNSSPYSCEGLNQYSLRTKYWIFFYSNFGQKKMKSHLKRKVFLMLLLFL